MVDVDKEEEPTMVVRELSVPPPQGLAFRFADGHVEPITAIMAVAGETVRETLERLAKDLGAELVTQVTSEGDMIHRRPDKLLKGEQLSSRGLKGLRMFVFTDAERVIRSQDRAIVLNEAGREVLVGLTEEETAVYMDYVRRYGLNKRLWTQARPDKAERATLLELHDKHETARLAAIGRGARSRRKSTK